MQAVARHSAGMALEVQEQASWKKTAIKVGGVVVGLSAAIWFYTHSMNSVAAEIVMLAALLAVTVPTIAAVGVVGTVAFGILVSISLGVLGYSAARFVAKHLG